MTFNKLIIWWHKHIMPPYSETWGFRIRNGYIPTWWKALPECVTHFWVWTCRPIIFDPIRNVKSLFTRPKWPEIDADDLEHLTAEERKALK